MEHTQIMNTLSDSVLDLTGRLEAMEYNRDVKLETGDEN